MFPTVTAYLGFYIRASRELQIVEYCGTAPNKHTMARIDLREPHARPLKASPGMIVKIQPSRLGFR
jgi:hypothetical protein